MSMTPREIVEEIDKHIVGQSAAKRSVAVTLRNRWRRAQVEDETLRAEITPKNIRLRKKILNESDRKRYSSSK